MTTFTVHRRNMIVPASGENRIPEGRHLYWDRQDARLVAGYRDSGFQTLVRHSPAVLEPRLRADRLWRMRG